MSGKWRTMASWATVMLRAAKQKEPPRGLVRHAQILRGKFLSQHSWKTADKAAFAQMLEVTAKFNDERLKDPECLAYVIKLATANAQWSEAQVKNERDKEWRKHVAG